MTTTKMNRFWRHFTNLAVADGEEVQVGSHAPQDRIGRNEDGSLDEIVIHNVDLHIEQMDKKFWWIGIYKGDKRMALNIHSKKAVILYIAANQLIDE